MTKSPMGAAHDPTDPAATTNLDATIVHRIPPSGYSEAASVKVPPGDN
ncbi:hypothetical protein ACFQ7A_08605 [Streptomyces sp. NPDC056528]